VQLKDPDLPYAIVVGSLQDGDPCFVEARTAGFSRSVTGGRSNFTTITI
jgi:hypothetical protein